MLLRGLKIPDMAHARRSVERIGYYRLSAFSYPFRDFCDIPDQSKPVRCDRFKRGATFDQVIAFYLWDKAIRMELMDAIERIEIAIRTALIEVIGKVNPHGHRDARTYKPRFSEDDTDGTFLAKFVARLESSFLRSKEEYAKHFLKNYAGPPPIWVEAGTWEWGNMTYILRFLDDKHKSAIAERIHPNLPRKTLESWVNTLNDIRNDCAHHSRIWNKPLVNSPGLPPRGTIPELDHLRVQRTGDDAATKRLYSAVVVMAFLLRQFYPNTQWPCRLRHKITDAALPDEISISKAGFPEDWSAHPVWQ